MFITPHTCICLEGRCHDICVTSLVITCFFNKHGKRNFEIGFRCLVLLEEISFDKIFEAVTQKLAIRCK